MWNHAFDFAFEVITDKEPDEVCAQELRAALLKRATELSDDELVEACGCFDTMEEGK